MKMPISHDMLLEAIHYDPETGIFISKITRLHVKVGQELGRKHSEGYTQIYLYGTRYFAHRIAIFFTTGSWPTNDVDHINGNRNDNRYLNLRCVTRSVNMQNQRQPRSFHGDRRSSRYLGVSWDKNRNKWFASIRIDGKKINLGRFHDESDAYDAYLNAKRKFHEGNTL